MRTGKCLITAMALALAVGTLPAQDVQSGIGDPASAPPLTGASVGPDKAPQTRGAAFNGAAEYNTTAFGWYAVISGGLFPNGQTVTGKKETGGSMRFIHDDVNLWGYPDAFQQWRKDGWFTETAGLALTMKNDGVIVFDNNGIEDGSYPANFYGDPADPNQITPGLYCGYSMSNNADWTYAGYFKLDVATEIDEIVGYFPETYYYPIDLGGPLDFNVNIYSSVPFPDDPNHPHPANTGAFQGDVLSSDTHSGTFSWSDTGVVRHYSGFSNNDDIIYRLTYKLDDPVTLPPGEYFFSHDAVLMASELDVLSLEADDDCYGPTDQVTVDIVLNNNIAEVTAGLFFLEYDNTVLDFVSIEPGDAPFTVEQVENVDEVAGTIDYTVSVQTATPPAGYTATGPIVMATITFDVIGENCDLEDAVAWRTPTPPFLTRLSQLVNGAATPLVPGDLEAMADIAIDFTAPVIDCPDDIVIGTDPGVCEGTIPYIETFDDPICVLPAPDPNFPDCWYKDRFMPAIFANGTLGGENVLRHGLDAADFQGYGNFYTTQGCKYDLDMPAGTVLAVDLYLPADWATSVRSCGLWATTYDSQFNITGYPILSYTSNDPADPGNTSPTNPTPRFRWYTQDTDQDSSNGYQPGYIDFYTPTVFDAWYRLEMELTNSAYIFRVLDASGMELASATDVMTWGSIRFGNVILQGYNFGESYDIYWDNLTVGPIVGGPVVDENCGDDVNATLTYERSDNPALTLYDPFPVGTTTITWTATDCAGNFASCDQLVTVEDTEDPTIACPADVSVTADLGVCYATGVVLGTPVTDDNCGVANVTNDAPAQFPVGDTVVTWTVTDGAGNTATCPQLVTVTDDEVPTITCPADVSVTADPGFCYATGVALGTPVTGDNCGVDTVTNDAPAQFPVGDTVVTWTVTDIHGNTATCTQLVTVTDDEDPIISGCPGDIVVNADAGGCDAVVTWVAPTATDNCGVDTFTGSHMPGDTFPQGTTTVTYTATDIHGNVSTCEFDVTVNGVSDLVVDVELQGSMAAAVTRCITFTFFDCVGTPIEFKRDITFDQTTGLGQAQFTLAEGDGVPCGDYSCVLVQDELHTLTRKLEIGSSAFYVSGTGEYVIDCTSATGNLLLQGDLYDDTADFGVDFIDVVDVGVYIAEWGANYDSDGDLTVDGNTPCGVFNVHADINGDGTLDTSDFAFITTNYLTVGEYGCCGSLGSIPQPRESITVEELRDLGLAHVARRADLNRDGVLDMLDYDIFMNQVLPQDDDRFEREAGQVQPADGLVAPAVERQLRR